MHKEGGSVQENEWVEQRDFGLEEKLAGSIVFLLILLIFYSFQENSNIQENS